MTEVVRRAAACGALVLFLGLPAVAQDPNADLRKEMEAIRRSQAEILKQLGEIKRLVEARPAAPAAAAAPPPQQQMPNVAGVIFELGTNPTRGSGSAALTLIEFSDYQ